MGFSYAAANFTLDVFLLVLLMAFLAPREPWKYIAICGLYLFAFFCPITQLQIYEAEMESRHLHEIEQKSHPTKRSPSSDGSYSSRVLQAQGLGVFLSAAQGLQDTTRTLGSAVGQSSRDDGATETAMARGGDALNGVMHQRGTGKYGSLLTAFEESLVEQGWFYARILLVFGLIPFFICDVKITFSVASMITIPVPYYVLLARLYIPKLGDKMELLNEDPSAFFHSGGLLAIPVMLFLGLLAVGFIYVFYQLCMQGRRHTLFVPDAGQYWVVIDGKQLPFQLQGTTLQVAGLDLDLKWAAADRKNPRLFKFRSGTQIEFIPRDSELMPSDKQR